MFHAAICRLQPESQRNLLSHRVWTIERKVYFSVCFIAFFVLFCFLSGRKIVETLIAWEFSMLLKNGDVLCPMGALLICKFWVSFENGTCMQGWLVCMQGWLVCRPSGYILDPQPREFFVADSFPIICHFLKKSESSECIFQCQQHEITEKYQV